MNGILAAYTDTKEFRDLIALGSRAIPDTVRLGRTFEASSGRYRERNSCDRFMVYAAAELTGVHPEEYPNRRMFWKACEEAGYVNVKGAAKIGSDAQKRANLSEPMTEVGLVQLKGGYPV